jgi:hypothetical protein
MNEDSETMDKGMYDAGFFSLFVLQNEPKTS